MKKRFLFVCIVIALASFFSIFGCTVKADFLMLAVAHAWRNNGMMTFAENNAYDGKWKY